MASRQDNDLTIRLEKQRRYASIPHDGPKSRSVSVSPTASKDDGLSIIFIDENRI